MQSKQQFCNLIFRTISRAATAALPTQQARLRRLFGLPGAVSILILTIAAVPGSAQNAVPPTARQAAASPAFASRLTRPATARAAGKSPVSAFSRPRLASPQSGVYDNGPVNGTVDAWTINFGYIVSDTFNASSVSGFDIWVWEFSGDKVSSVDWSITSEPNGGTIYGSGTASVSDTFFSTNQYGYNIDRISASGLDVKPGGTWFNVQNAVVPSGDPVFWDENSGIGCQSQGCPSQAYQDAVGTIPSEAFELHSGCVYSGSGNFEPIHKLTGGADGAAPTVQSAPAQSYQVIYNFSGGADGAYPQDGLTIDKAGNLYVPTNSAVSKLTLKGSSWMSNLLYSISAGPLTIGPYGNLYAGGVESIVKLTPAPTVCKTALCPWTETVLYLFTGIDGWMPNGALVFDEEGNIYGTTASGGLYGKGTVFKLAPAKDGWTESVLYSFTGGSDGSLPGNGVILDKAGNLFGTTYYGGSSGCGPLGNGCGTVFQLTPSVSGWVVNTLHIFQAGNDGANPDTGLIFDQAGSLYGTANGGTNGGGTVFELSPSNGTWTFSTLYSLYSSSGKGGPTGGSLTIDVAGNLYGNTLGGGAYGWGSVFKLAPGNGGWTYTSLHDFIKFGDCDDSEIQPMGNMGFDAAGNLYGTTHYGGNYSCDIGYNGCGVVWEITP